MSRRTAVGLALVAGFVVACQPAAEDPAQKAAELEATRAAVQQAADGWDTAFRAGDLEGIVASYTDDAVAMPPGVPAMNGREAVAGIFAEMFAAGSTTDSSLTTDELGVGDDDWVFRRGHFKLVIAPEEGDPVTANGKFIEIWSKGPDGRWRISRDIWNMDGPPSTGPAAE